jgi:shikimate dehydrogenase
MNVSGKTRLLGVIGHPIEHSLSPRMHNASFAATGLDYVYLPLDVRPESLPEAIAGLRALGFGGFNVTMPHKEKILPLLDELEEPARLTEAVNTVVLEEGFLRGTNTDGSGFVEAAAEAGVGFAESRVVLLGAGGAAAAIGAAVLGEGASGLRLVNRTRARAERLRERLRTTCPEATVSIHEAEEVSEAVLGADVVVNATYLGMEEGDPLPLPAPDLDAVSAVCDAVYRRGGETDLVRVARERGLQTVSGGRMLLYQGVQAQRLWTGREPDVRAMSDALA